MKRNHAIKKNSKTSIRPGLLAAVLLMVVVWGCRGALPLREQPGAVEGKGALLRMGYTIQAGAFSSVGNAARLTKTLQGKGLEAYYFLHDSGLFKVRFGNYVSPEAAMGVAELLHRDGTIEEYYIVRPEEYPGLTTATADRHALRKGIVLSTKRFIGVPYKWGGDSDRSGFDCSGLTMAVYQLNGLSLPRTSDQQWGSGTTVTIEQLSEGDLVFFAVKKSREVSHVGIYVGNGEFIHAPGRGKKIRLDSLSDKYFQDRFRGGRAYL